MKRNLTDDDLKAIAELWEKAHPCRFSGITEEDMYEMVKFCKSANETMQNDKMVIRQTLIKMGLYCGGGLLTLGLGTWVVNMFKGG